MIKCIDGTSLYKSLKLDRISTHADLFYTDDSLLNNEVALSFAETLLCNTHTGHDNCDSCKQVESLSHPDYSLLNQDSIKVEDINKIMAKLDTKPIVSDKKVFVILNFENVNEISQNKLLKSFEEPNSSNIFILTSAHTDKILGTIMSRLTKIFVPRMSSEDKSIIAKDLLNNNIDISKYMKLDKLTDMVNFATNENYIATLNSIRSILTALNSTSDIPRLVSNLNLIDKNLFLKILQELFLDSLLDETNWKFDADLVNIVKEKFSNKVVLKCLPIIEDSYKKLISNVNFTYILDNLLFNILKEKFYANK